MFDRDRIVNDIRLDELDSSTLPQFALYTHTQCLRCVFGANSVVISEARLGSNGLWRLCVYADANCRNFLER